MKRFFVHIFILVSFFLLTSIAYALTEQDITFPVSELNNCKNEKECRSFCDIPKNRRGVCFDFAKKHNLVTKEEIDKAEKFTKVSLGGGPGRCRDLEDCEQFCDIESNLTQCLDFTEKNGLMSAEGLKEARKVAETLNTGKEFPGGCRGKNACFVYCNDPNHVQECFEFANKNGYNTPEIMEQFQSFSKFLKNGQTPGGCRSKDECESFCAKEKNNDACLDFAKKSGLITKEQAEWAVKTGGGGPGGCKSKEECGTYCNNPANQNACLQFAKEQNIPIQFNGPGGCSDVDSCTKYCTEHKDDAACKQNAGQYGGSKGPGGCSDKDSCTKYCTDHQSDPECAKMAGQYGGINGPGGCKDIASCTEYCKSNYSDPECAKYAGQAGGQYSGGMPKGPGGCSDIASCTSYCKANPKDSECAQYAGQYGGGEQQPQDQQSQQQSQPSP